MGNIRQLVKKIYQAEQHQMSAENACNSMGSYFHEKEARRLLAINVYNCFDVGEPVFLIPDDQKWVKSYKVITQTELSEYKCKICSHKKCKECHYQMKCDSDKYMVLDDLLILSIAFRSALNKGQVEVAIELSDQIIDLLRLDLPKLDSSRSRFSPSKFITMSLALNSILGPKGL